MEIPGLGAVVEDADFDGYRSKPIRVPVLNGAECEFILRGYDDDDEPEDFHQAISTFLGLGPNGLDAARPAIYAYYLDVKQELGDELDIEIAGPDDVLDHVELGNNPEVLRNNHGDERIYVMLESECAWEPDHGLQLVFRDGAEITRVSQYDGHLTDE